MKIEIIVVAHDVCAEDMFDEVTDKLYRVLRRQYEVAMIRNMAGRYTIIRIYDKKERGDKHD